jgi:hypothetical protein
MQIQSDIAERLVVQGEAYSTANDDLRTKFEVEKSGSPFLLLFENMYVTVWAFLEFCCTVETFMVLLTTAASVSFFLWWPNQYDHGFLDANLSWTVLAFLVTFPLTYSLNNTFSRRERALSLLAKIRALFIHIHIAHHEWDWDKGEGRTNSRLPDTHTNTVHTQLLELSSDMFEWISLPTVNTTRHLLIPRAIRRAEQVVFLLLSMPANERLSIRPCVI